MNERGFWLRKATTSSTARLTWASPGALTLPVTRHTVTTAFSGPVPSELPALPPDEAGQGPANEPRFWFRYAATWSAPTTTWERIGAVALPLTRQTVTAPASGGMRLTRAAAACGTGADERATVLVEVGSDLVDRDRHLSKVGDGGAALRPCRP